jgi:8-oxo-dGTP pyrophosphatase MutT (NUDIX family)
VGKDTQNQTVLTSREFSSGGVVFKGDGKNVLWLVTASMPSELYPKIVWRLPKGWIDNETPDIPGPKASGKVKADEESLEKAALREVREEGGIIASIIKKIGTEKYFFNAPDKGKILKFGTFYLMEWVKDVPEGHDEETSEIVWLPFDEAIKKLSYSGEKEMLKKAEELLAPVA